MKYLDNFKNSSVLVTGHTGFKGSWLCAWLNHLGANVAGIALDPPTTPSHYMEAKLWDKLTDHRIDIRNQEALKSIVLDTQPDFVFHLAAQALVRRSYMNPLETYHTNVLGTLHLLEALRELNKPCIAVLITSDKCYDNVEWVWGYRETDRLGGNDPYSASKGATELMIKSHVKSYFPTDGMVRIGIARAGNVIGGGDWAKDRIIPDCVRSWAFGNTALLQETQQLRAHGSMFWNHLEDIFPFTSLKKDPEQHGEPFNFGPSASQNYSVLDLVVEIEKNWNNVKWEISSDKNIPRQESGLLKLNCDKAMIKLKWKLF